MEQQGEKVPAASEPQKPQRGVHSEGMGWLGGLRQSSGSGALGADGDATERWSRSAGWTI